MSMSISNTTMVEDTILMLLKVMMVVVTEDTVSLLNTLVVFLPEECLHLALSKYAPLALLIISQWLLCVKFAKEI